MLVYRITKEQYANDLSGYGAKLYGGRWNLIGSPCLYTSQSRALALLEYSVNVNIDFMPSRLFFSIIEINDHLIEFIDKKDLPPIWNSIPSSSSTKIFGSEKLSNSNFPILRLPSVVISNEYNFIINPLKIDSEGMKIINIEEYEFDFRIKK
ncbi:RES family NAD+ phosphorylase [Flavobacterium sp.]|jgi:RES domain-containing protein|uniref:RES family NAD+ phosphorylase n=1 Tax=Flavobacterium sp. TaxID=239 RepID=UPI0037C01C2F